MMDCTDRHCRRLMRFISAKARLYTEMVTAQALAHARDPQRFLAHDPAEYPLALQVGGSDPGLLANAARMAAAAGFQEINLNVGCPSDRVTSGRFGACLMAEPDLVRVCVAAMADAVDIPVTVKTRIGIDDREDDAILDTLVDVVAAAGCRTVIVHARRAILSGLSPKENREIPPLKYDRVARLKLRRPDLTIVLNGGLTSLDACERHLGEVDGVMLGRAAYERPYEVLSQVDTRLFGAETAPPSETDVVCAYLDYAQAMCAAGVRRSAVLRHMVGLFRGRPGARAWRQVLSAANRSDFSWRAVHSTAEHIGCAEPLAA
ncbi:MAG: tRNA dihydrouridine(20/20a) synthase DusA [Rhodospirillaceae bacterium]|nr:tRNA dihydrouridine(20/20a) synthase DusA [Rhodospirillaceae bacterium]